MASGKYPKTERTAGVSKPRSVRPTILDSTEKVPPLTQKRVNPTSLQYRTPSEVEMYVATDLDEEKVIKRLRWARRYEHFTPEDWARVFWSDECTVERGIGVRQEWTFIRRKDQCRLHQVQGLPYKGRQVKQMFWAAFSGAQRRSGLILLLGGPEPERGGVNRFVIRDLYTRNLPILLANEGSIFQHDNAPTHTAYVVRDALREMGIEVMAEIYKIRPDLLDTRNNDETKAIFAETAQIAWGRLDLDHLKHLSDTMPRRVKAIIESEGWYTSY
ncbi:hypothetical protein N7457_004941 [Penicillium paradoxum]|uniref:uncharacterized protein n=1 Tax=Penicillium paradoxum TaxID=176176 RepID=UPI0025493762|nr:uncharacterized protein N7457_004941 [Penicillium paradoxum]KAJ5783167.1 hypothetical protein N7457_004941 [Penicillium paradoxum]